MRAILNTAAAGQTPNTSIAEIIADLAPGSSYFYP